MAQIIELTRLEATYLLEFLEEHGIGSAKKHTNMCLVEKTPTQDDYLEQVTASIIKQLKS